MATHVYHWKHGWIPLDHVAAMKKAKGNIAAAATMLKESHHVEYRKAGPTSVTAHINGERVAEMSWHPGDKHIVWTSVYDEKNRRKGIASGMLAHALKHEPGVRHNRGGGDGLTADGKAFASATPTPSEKNGPNPTPSVTPPAERPASILDKMSDASILSRISELRKAAPASPELKILLREAYHRGLDTRGK